MGTFLNKLGIDKTRAAASLRQWEERWRGFGGRLTAETTIG